MSKESKMKMDKISAILIVQNEEENLPHALKSIEWVDEIIVVDSGSTDKTIEIAHSFDAKIFYNEFKGFGEQKQFALSKTSNNWVLSLDADEVVSDELKNEIINLPNTINDTFMIPRKNIFLGKVLKYGTGATEYIVRLFNKNECQFSDDLVHEYIVTDTTKTKLKSPIIHRPYRNLSHYISKLNNYTSLMADKYYKKGKHITPLLALIKGMFAFVNSLILKKGLLDGNQGVIWAFLHSIYTTLKYLKLWEKSL